jgi:hypothetical protein
VCASAVRVGLKLVMRAVGATISNNGSLLAGTSAG